MIYNETMQSILARRSYKVFDSKPIDDENLETIITAGLYAPTGMNRQPWHFTVIKSEEGLARFAQARRSLPLPPGIPPEAAARFGDPMRNAPVMILVSAKEGGTSFEDSCLAMENMFIAAASFGIMSGWDHATVKDLFNHDPELKKELIPEGYVLYAAAFFGYPGPEVKDRGERKGTVQYI
ncbi:MAG: nitroreductase family protein [Erysipelotrichaceae bacterium]|nr:nitroreductase family protein [Erysipelotrichaceae bacterium]